MPQHSPIEGHNPNFEERIDFPKNYFSCGQLGHFAKYYPNLGIQGNLQTILQYVNQPYRQDKIEVVPSGVRGSRRLKSQGKVCAMTQSETRDSPHMNIGSLMVCNSSTPVLFDSKVAHSFISL